MLLTLTDFESAHAAPDENFSYSGYMRAGTGSNTKGGDQYCFNQSGIPGNEFRLGNECTIYGESAFQVYTPEAKRADGEFFRANFGFSYKPAGKNAVEAPNFNIINAFIEAGRLSGGDEVYWVGKRYYRDTDLYTYDFFYFADTSGNGGGVQDIPFFRQKLALAVLFEDESKSLAPGAPPVMTENGRPRTILFDARVFEVKLDGRNQLNFWTGYATSTGGTDLLTGATYDNSFGYVFGVKEQYRIRAGYNRMAAIYGHGLMQGLNLGGPFGADPVQLASQNYTKHSYRWRLVEEFTFQPWNFFAIPFATIFESWKPGIPGFDSGRWTSVGTRPTYYFNDHYSVAVEIGVSNVKQSGQAGTVSGAPLVRATIAPQIVPKNVFFARPSLRAFFTDTFGKGASYGFQGEVWF
jgi:maltoporin